MAVIATSSARSTSRIRKRGEEGRRPDPEQRKGARRAVVPDRDQRKVSMGEFRGFGPNALPFFKALTFHQSKDWFEENRSLYETDVLQPMVALLDDVTAAFAKKRVALKADG